MLAVDSSARYLATVTRRPLFVVLLSLPLVACTIIETVDDDEGNGSTAPSTSTGGDGKYHPTGNGEMISEDAACALLSEAFEETALGIPGCAKTAPVCPNLLRVQFTQACMFYDQGTVEACVTFIEDTTICTDLTTDGCVVSPFYETAGQGCE